MSTTSVPQQPDQRMVFLQPGESVIKDEWLNDILNRTYTTQTRLELQHCATKEQFEKYRAQAISSIISKDDEIFELKFSQKHGIELLVTSSHNSKTLLKITKILFRCLFGIVLGAIGFAGSTLALPTLPLVAVALGGASGVLIVGPVVHEHFIIRKIKDIKGIEKHLDKQSTESSHLPAINVSNQEEK